MATEPTFTAEVTTTEGLTTIQIRDRTGRHPTLQLFERTAEGQEVWFGAEDCAFALCQEQA